MGCFEWQNTGLENQLKITKGRLSNHPNPFNPSTTIWFALESESNRNIELIIYNLKGQQIKTFIIDPASNQLKYEVVWNGNDNLGNPVSSGIYFVKIKNTNQILAKKMILLK